MKILHLSSAITWRGGEQQIAYLIEELGQIGIKQRVFCVRGSAMHAFCEEKGIPHTIYKKSSSISPGIARKLARTCRKYHFDLIHAHDSHAHTYACMAATFFGNATPIVLSRRVDFPIQPNIFSRWKYNHKQIRKILCVSAFIKKILKPDIKDPDKLVVVHSGIDLSRFGKKPTGRLHKEYELSTHLKLIGNVASIAPHKDYFTFVDTARQLLSLRDDLHFFIIGGDGGEKEAIEQYIANKGLTDYLTLTGFRTDIPEILPELDVFLFTSKTEGLGTSVLDALASGVPMVATKAGGIPEMIDHEENGLLADVKDAPGLASCVNRMLEDPHLRDQCIARGKERVKGFSKKAMAERTLGYYKELING